MRSISLTRVMFLLLSVASALIALPAHAATPGSAPARILVFTKTAKFRHDSIPDAVRTVRQLGRELGLQVDHTEDATRFDARLSARYRAVVFAQTTGDVLDAAQQAALEDFIRAGGGYLGIHAAADTEYDWPWYGQLVGAWFKSHPPGLQHARIQLLQAPDAPAWYVTDELYQYRAAPPAEVTVLAQLVERDDDDASDTPAPIAWCRPFDGGRSWYTGLGHEAALYRDPRYLEQLRNGLRFVAGTRDLC
ncbi:MAG: ThuA domain-containing protein [Pseudoxanthomonas sp.]